MLSRKILKIQSPRLAKNAFLEISAWKNQMKMSQHVALLLNLGLLKNLSVGFGGGGQLTPLPPPASYGPAITSQVAKKIAPCGTSFNNLCNGLLQLASHIQNRPRGESLYH